jgi:hypothetical protein
MPPQGGAGMTDQTFRRIFLVEVLWNFLGAGPFLVFWRQGFAFWSPQ